ncbi:hypothetical protein BDQ17DRAFT_1432767 [Cyathus striatus]|nr:hypothetical protein BDQ17DRAFT_1432767 [Cyathus striatus]
MPVVCPKCGKKLQGGLARHLKTHGTEKNYACDVWVYAAHQPDAVERHKKRHHLNGLRPYHCPYEGCNKSYADSSCVVRHKKKVHEHVTVQERKKIEAEARKKALARTASEPMAPTPEASYSSPSVALANPLEVETAITARAAPSPFDSQPLQALPYPFAYHSAMDIPLEGEPIMIPSGTNSTLGSRDGTPFSSSEYYTSSINSGTLGSEYPDSPYTPDIDDSEELASAGSCGLHETSASENSWLPSQSNYPYSNYCTNTINSAPFTVCYIPNP